MNLFTYFQGGQCISCQFGGLEARKTLLVGAVKPEKHRWICVDPGKHGEVHTLEYWNARYRGGHILVYLKQQELTALKFTIISCDQLQVTNRGALLWRLEFWPDSGICCLAQIHQNISASTWLRGRLWLFLHPLRLLQSAKKVGVDWEQGTIVSRYNQNCHKMLQLI